MDFAQHILRFLRTLDMPSPLPAGIQVMHPFPEPSVWEICEQFYHTYYNDDFTRTLIIGINPGRFGGGITGIPFTDPIRLKDSCNIDNPWPKKQELSSVFIYDMIRAFGGPAAFYRQFYITAISPLGFTRHNKNLNYYDDKSLQQSLEPFILKWMNEQLDFGVNRQVAFCLGEGKNFNYLSSLNKRFHFFDSIIPLSHPRFIMQYKLKRKQEYIQSYLDQFSQHAFSAPAR